MSGRLADKVALISGGGSGIGAVAGPAEIANCCLFLVSEEASFVTGAVLVADGGGEVVDVGTLAFADW